MIYIIFVLRDTEAPFYCSYMIWSKIIDTLYKILLHSCGIVALIFDKFPYSIIYVYCFFYSYICRSIVVFMILYILYKFCNLNIYVLLIKQIIVPVLYWEMWLKWNIELKYIIDWLIVAWHQISSISALYSTESYYKSD